MKLVALKARSNGKQYFHPQHTSKLKLFKHKNKQKLYICISQRFRYTPLKNLLKEERMLHQPIKQSKFTNAEIYKLFSAGLNEKWLNGLAYTAVFPCTFCKKSIPNRISVFQLVRP